MLTIAPAAGAAEVGRAALGARITSLLAGGDGAWVAAERRDGTAVVGRATAGALSFTRTGASVDAATVGPDGQAWFTAGRRLLRGPATTVATLPGPGPYAIATGPDAALWAMAKRGEQLVRVTPAGAVSAAPSGLPACPFERVQDAPVVDDLIRAADGVVWAVDEGCQRVLRLAPGGPLVVAIDGLDAEVVAADTSGGLWVGATGDAYMRHVDAAGAVRSFALPETATQPRADDVAGAPDGGAVYAFGDCSLVRVSAGGAVSMERPPVPAERVAFDGQGVLWLAGGTVVARLAPGETAGDCDDSGPSIELRSPWRVRLAALRRDGVRYRVGARTVLVVDGYFDDDVRGRDLRYGSDYELIAPAGERRYRVPSAQLRRFARRLDAGARPQVVLNVRATDADGNDTVALFHVRVTR